VHDVPRHHNSLGGQGSNLQQPGLSDGVCNRA
jgi:hypothetical protein